MKKKIIIFIVLVFISCFLFVGCNARLDIRADNTAVLKAIIPADELKSDSVSDLDIDEYIDTFFSSEDIIDTELKSFRTNKKGSHIKVKITPEKDVNKTYKSGFAIGNAYLVFGEFLSDNYDEFKWRNSKEKIKSDMENALIFAVDESGEKLSFAEVEKIMNKSSLRVRKAVFIKGGFFGTELRLPKKAIITFSKSTDIKQEGRRTVILGSDDALIIYKSNFFSTFISILILVLVLCLFYYIIKKKKKDKVSDESPQESVVTDFCASCGAKLDSHDKFCRKCGTVVPMEED